MTKSKDSRYPYTYACDYIRSLAGYGEQGTKIGRSDASTIMKGIAQVIGIDDEELACKLADYYKENEERIADESAQEFLRILSAGRQNQ
jgi:hypothetical protein